MPKFQAGLPVWMPLINQTSMLIRSPRISREEESMAETFLEGANGVLLGQVEFLLGG